MERPRRLPSGSCKTAGTKPSRWPNTQTGGGGNAGRGSCRPSFRQRIVAVAVVVVVVAAVVGWRPTGGAGTGPRRPALKCRAIAGRRPSLLRFPATNKRPFRPSAVAVAAGLDRRNVVRPIPADCWRKPTD